MNRECPLFTTALLALALQAGAEETIPPPSAKADRPAEIHLSWKPPAESRSAQVWRRDRKGRWQQLTEFEQDLSAFRDRNLRIKGQFSYKIRFLGPGQKDSLGGMRESAPSPPISPLKPYYVQLRSLKNSKALLYVHRWDSELEEWLRSDLYKVGIGEEIGKEGLLTDFSTGAVLRKCWRSKDPKLEWLRYETPSGEATEVSNTQALPPALLEQGKKKKKKKKKKTKGPATKPVASLSQPKRVGSVPGKKVVWEIVNYSKTRLRVDCVGPARRVGFVPAGKTHAIKLPKAGDYQVKVSVFDRKTATLKGEFTLVAGARYRTVFGIRNR